MKTIDKFKGADADRSGWLTPAEYATTAPPPPKHKTVRLLGIVMPGLTRHPLFWLEGEGGLRLKSGVTDCASHSANAARARSV